MSLRRKPNHQRVSDATAATRDNNVQHRGLQERSRPPGDLFAASKRNASWNLVLELCPNADEHHIWPFFCHAPHVLGLPQDGGSGCSRAHKVTLDSPFPA